MTKLEYAFRYFSNLRELIVKEGIGVNVRNFRDALDQGLDVFAGAIQELENKKPVRNIVQIAGTANRIYALCDNGELWEMNHDGIWTAHPSIPVKEETV